MKYLHEVKIMIKIPESETHNIEENKQTYDEIIYEIKMALNKFHFSNNGLEILEVK